MHLLEFVCKFHRHEEFRINSSVSGGDKKEKGLSEFEEYLPCQDIHQIVGRVSHPQTNGNLLEFPREIPST